MRLEEMTWLEVDAYLKTGGGVILPTGSVEQHGPIGMIGTDAICAREIAWAAAAQAKAIVVPEIAYAPAPFNMGFAGTVSLEPSVYQALLKNVLDGLAQHGFEKIYILNGHGANLEHLRSVATTIDAEVRLKSWWDFDCVNALRSTFYGDWEGMHATPSEISITQHTHRAISDAKLKPPRKLSREYIQAHAGDRHGPPDEHRREFPDGRVGSHSGLAKPAHGKELLNAAAKAVAADYQEFLG